MFGMLVSGASSRVVGAFRTRSKFLPWPAGYADATRLGPALRVCISVRRSGRLNLHMQVRVVVHEMLPKEAEELP